LSRVIIILVVLATAVLLFSFVFKINTDASSDSTIENNKVEMARHFDDAIEKRLKQQVINQFYSFVDYDLEALDEYAPQDEEMDAYYKIFDENAFQEKFNFFAKNYTVQGMNFGEDAFYDRDLILRVGARGSVLRARSNILNSEQIRLGDDDIEIDTTYVKPNLSGKNFYDLHVRFYHPKSEGYYEFVNEACWLTDRTCINTLSWKFLGRYNKYTQRYSFSQLNMKNL